MHTSISVQFDAGNGRNFTDMVCLVNGDGTNTSVYGTLQNNYPKLVIIKLICLRMGRGTFTFTLALRCPTDP